MKLTWKHSEPNRWTAEGKTRSYAVLYDPASAVYPYKVMQMLQPGGQIINSNATTSLPPAQARAQVWEDGQ